MTYCSTKHAYNCTRTEELLQLTAILTDVHFTEIHKPNTHYLWGTMTVRAYHFSSTASIVPTQATNIILC